jgi:hypothetical protein
MPNDTDSLGTQIIEVEGPSDPNPGPVPESSLRRWEALRELYRQSESNQGNLPRPEPRLGDESSA